MNNSGIDRMRRSAVRSAALSIGGVMIVIATLTYSYVQLRSLQRRTADMRVEISGLEKHRSELTADITAKTAEVNKLTEDARLLQTTIREMNATLRKKNTPEEAKRETESAILAAAQVVQPRVIPARVYIQIAVESNRAVANQITRLLQAGGFLVPGIELVRAVPRRPELRYFREADKAEAERAVAAISAQVPDLKAVLVPGHENSTSIRPRHLELWM